MCDHLRQFCGSIVLGQAVFTWDLSCGCSQVTPADWTGLNVPGGFLTHIPDSQCSSLWFLSTAE